MALRGRLALDGLQRSVSLRWKWDDRGRAGRPSPARPHASPRGCAQNRVLEAPYGHDLRDGGPATTPNTISGRYLAAGGMDPSTGPVMEGYREALTVLHPPDDAVGCLTRSRSGCATGWSARSSLGSTQLGFPGGILSRAEGSP